MHLMVTEPPRTLKETMMEAEQSSWSRDLGVQVPRRVHAEVSQEGAFRQDKTESGSSVSRSGATQGVPDRRREFLVDQEQMG